MMIATRPEPTCQSAIFFAPGRPRPLARRLAIHNQVIRSVREFFYTARFHEVPVTALADHPARVQLEGMIAHGFHAVWCESEIMPDGGKLEPRELRGFKLIEVSSQELDLTGICELAENLVKHVANNLSADLLGGLHVTRLDRMIQLPHQRLSYSDALKVLAGKGWDVAFGEALPDPAKATLTRHCGNLPFVLTELPVDLKQPGVAILPDQPQLSRSMHYILPYSGLTIDGSVRGGINTPAGFSLDLGRLLQYLMGLDDITDTLIDPMDKVVGVMRRAPRGTSLARTLGAG